jgi:glycosyltransferase involved in cell wall biosynthesis
VGSVRDSDPSNLAYAERLRRLADATPGVELVDGFLEDWEFDAWIAAADAVVLPYRRSWSSGVLARAQALGTPAIVTAVGGLPEQASRADVVVDDDEQLAVAVREVAGRSVPRETSG